MTKQLSVKEAVESRRSIKNFNGQPVACEEVMSVFESAKWAPNHGNREPWRIVLAVGETMGAFREVIRDINVPNWKELSEEELAKKLKAFLTPGAIAVVIVREDARQKERLEDFAATSAFIQNAQLVAWEDGIGTCWKTPPLIDHPKFRDACGIQGGERVVGLLKFGHFDETPQAKPRKSAEEFVTVFKK